MQEHRSFRLFLAVGLCALLSVAYIGWAGFGILSDQQRERARRAAIDRVIEVQQKLEAIRVLTEAESQLVAERVARENEQLWRELAKLERLEALAEQLERERRAMNAVRAEREHTDAAESEPTAKERGLDVALEAVRAEQRERERGLDVALEAVRAEQWERELAESLPETERELAESPRERLAHLQVAVAKLEEAERERELAEQRLHEVIQDAERTATDMKTKNRVPVNDNTQTAQLAYNRPEYLELGDTTPFQLVLSPNPQEFPPAAEIDSAAPGERETREVNIPVTVITAELRGSADDFRIEPKARQSRTVTGAMPEIWTWHVTPLRPGDDKPLTVEVLGYPDGLDSPGYTISVFVETFRVHVGLVDRVIWIAKEAQPLQIFGAALVTIVVGGWTFFSFFRRRKDGDSGNGHPFSS